MEKKESSTRSVFLFDVDNTLLDSDKVMLDLRTHLNKEVGRKGAEQYWKIVEHLHDKLGYADYLGALQRYRCENPHHLRILTVSCFLLDYPFARRLFEGALVAIAAVKQWGGFPVILSDGDVVFQPVKVERSGLLEAVNRNALIYIHKEKELQHVAKRFPSKHYVLLDDNLRVLAAIKNQWGERVTTVFVNQGHYAKDPKIVKKYPPADITLDRIGNLVKHDLQRFVNPTGS